VTKKFFIAKMILRDIRYSEKSMNYYYVHYFFYIILETICIKFTKIANNCLFIRLRNTIELKKKKSKFNRGVSVDKKFHVYLQPYSVVQTINCTVCLILICSKTEEKSGISYIKYYLNININHIMF